MEKWIRLTRKLDQAADYVLSALCIGFAVFLLFSGYTAPAILFGFLGFNIIRALAMDKKAEHFERLYLAQAQISDLLAKNIIEHHGLLYLEQVLEINQPSIQSHEHLEHPKK